MFVFRALQKLRCSRNPARVAGSGVRAIFQTGLGELGTNNFLRVLLFALLSYKSTILVSKDPSCQRTLPPKAHEVLFIVLGLLHELVKR